MAHIKNAIGGLKPRHQAIVALRFVESLEITEIAEVFGCSPATARSQLSRALAQLRGKLRAAAHDGRTGGKLDE
jgi:RNA polymerase sigma factor (sigma-70 family)